MTRTVEATRTVELHGHRGARGLLPENTLPGFAHALDLGVDAVELDVGLSADGVVVLGHDQVLSPVTLTDTGPAHPGDPAFPYVGKAVRDLTLAQLRTLDAGVRRPGDAFAVTQRAVPGTPIPTLAEVCALVAPSGADLAVELKTDPSWPDAEVARFVAAVADVLHGAGLAARSRLLAFDWRVLARTPASWAGSRSPNARPSSPAARGSRDTPPATPSPRRSPRARPPCRPSTRSPPPASWTTPTPPGCPSPCGR
ncbi:glycerophosphodiester phosphodiesterase family protein [Actinomadura sp. WMMB 499]|uniref:glycerophosphodiester phosphodiesterase family protein n=1 Tax=Actinomadura sp. WMMB 499 TaxID=1219491 RepID=UPI0020C7EF9F|nr:glycerophosphodiester phosphodiesterase family protein [Actinomadura sp. WMMB 499]